MATPPFRGGQGRSDRDMVADARAMLSLLAVVLVLVLLLLCGGGR